MDLSFVILNYQSEKFLDSCISSIEKNINGLQYEIIVVNNDSEKLQFFKNNRIVHILNVCSNIGFSRACNLGAKEAKGRILFFLNPDTQLLNTKISDFLFLLAKEDVGAIAPSLITKNGLTQPWSGGKKITPLGTILSKLFKKSSASAQNNSHIINLDWVSGAAFLINKKLFEKVGGFDEKFFMYFEDVDLCLRLRKLKKRILLLYEPRVLHYGGCSASDSKTQKKLYYASQDYYFKKHFGLLQSTLAKACRSLFIQIKDLLPQSCTAKLFSILLFICTILPLQFALNPTTGVDLAIIRVLIPVFFLACCYYKYKNKTFLQAKDNLTFYITTFLLLAMTSLLFTQNIHWSLRKLAFLFSLFPIYFIATFLLDSQRKQRKAIAALVFGGSIVSIFALVQFSFQFIFGIEKDYSFLAQTIIPFFLGNTFSKEVLAYPSWLVNSGGITYMRAFAPFPDPHMLSYYVGMLLPWAIALWATSKSHKFFFLIAASLLTICDIATFTRGGYLALITAAIIIMPLVTRKTVLKIFSGIFLFLFLFFIVPKNPVTNPVAGRITSAFDINEGSNQGRITMWKEALVVIAKHPEGVGIGSYPLIIDPGATYRVPIYTHNFYLDLAVELGIMASFLFILILGIALRNYWQASRENSFYVAGVASIVIFATHSLVENPLYSVHILPLILIILAMSSTRTLAQTKKCNL